MNRALTLSVPVFRPSRWATRSECLSFLIPAAVGLKVTRVEPAARGCFLDVLIR